MDSLKPENNKNNLYGILKDMNPDQIDFSKAPTAGPKTQGFDYSFVLPASLDMAPYCYLENDKLTEPLSSFTKGNKLESGYTGPFWREGLMSPNFDFYDVLPFFTRKANDFIRRQAGSKNPFFLYFPMPAPHTPWVPTKDFKGKSKVGEYGDYVLEMDAAVGQVLHVLDSMGLSKNTIVIFSSDNGPYWRDNFVEQFNHHAAGPFRGMKGDVFEGGHRVPLIVRYPGKTKAVLMGKAKLAEGQEAVVNISSKGTLDIRKDGWKLITKLGSGGFTVPVDVKAKPGEPIGQLYHLTEDIHEDHNLYAEHPEKVRELMDLLKKIQKAPKGQSFK
jgi:arylsulfatase A-like enzyme